jgi:hypothetical protein
MSSLVEYEHNFKIFIVSQNKNLYLRHTSEITECRDNRYPLGVLERDVSDPSLPPYGVMK